MAPELALERLPKKPARTLDQMIGSGTIPVFAGVAGHSATGYDLDPLALLIAEVWGRALGRAFRSVEQRGTQDSNWNRRF